MLVCSLPKPVACTSQFRFPVWLSSSSIGSQTVTGADGGYEFFGDCCLDGWACTQQSRALSSGESELYGICNGAARVLWTRAVLRECGVDVSATVGTDSSAAKGITARLGTGRVRRVEVRCLRIQDRVRDKELIVKKIGTEENRGDMQTKALDPGRFWQLVDALPFDFATGCSQSTGTAPSSGTLVTAIGSRSYEALATIVLAGNFMPSAAVRSSGDDPPRRSSITLRVHCSCR